jgi:hypothetical protein
MLAQDLRHVQIAKDRTVRPAHIKPQGPHRLRLKHVSAKATDLEHLQKAKGLAL